MLQTSFAFPLSFAFFAVLTLAPSALLHPAVGQDSPSNESIHAAGYEFIFSTADQGRAILTEDDPYIQALSPFDRQARMQSEGDPGKQAFLDFIAGEVIEWPESDRESIRNAIEALDEPLKSLELPKLGPILLVHTTGREESGAAYTRGSAIFLPHARVDSSVERLQKLIAHELFHVLTRNRPKWRDQLYSVIGFQRVQQVGFPETLADRRITNPDAPRIEHVLRVKLDDDQTVVVAPVLFAKSKFDPQQRYLFSYIDFRLMEVEQTEGDRWTPKMVDGEAVMHAPSLPDFHRQIGRNTGYIIHPEEILAENFTALLTAAEVKDEWVIDGMKKVFAAGTD